MSKTVAISDEVHILISKKQLDMREKYKIYLKISDIANFILKDNIDKLEDIIRSGINVETTKEESVKVQ